MQVKEGFFLRKAGKQYVVVPAGAVSQEFNGMLRMNEVGAFLFKYLMEGTTIEDLTRALCEEYTVEESQARQDAEAFVQKLVDAGLMKTV